ncbi:hypothetical protein GCM10008995_02800 [Halobellus salinus]|uniref:PKD domain-containing protein n=1 Tax=Halobellus salinus TaxID=931585 RepID=A0A830E798_9EURY|nr:PKD domain-containing protein [Halobellus salinus]GGI96153.1 hypothetical protein GCM10008995_02800 [Halobellus salinus]SMP13012.1 PGF-CTERM protein/PGF-pre-PGF domain-containing protein [Halobellus salinus]
MRTSATIFVVVCLVISTIAFTPTASAGPPGNDQVFNVNDDVDAWERAIFPLRVDYDGAAESVENPRINAEGTGIGEKSLAKGKMVVYEPGDEIGLSFISDRAVTGDLDNDNITVVAARMTGGNEGDIPNTFSEAIDLLSEDNANDNATFEFVAENTSLDSAGDTEDLSYEASQSGHYVFFAVSNFQSGSNGVSINNGDISFTDVTLLGTDAVSVQEGSADVSQTTENPQPGDDITFDVDASDELGTSDVTHVLAVYNKSGFTDSSHTIEVDSDELDSDFDIQNNSTFEHSIATVDGVADVEDGASVNGIGLADGRVSRAVGAGAMIDFIAEDLDGTAPETTAVEPKSTLNASIDADVDEDGEHTLTIETNSDWEDGTYQYVYLGTLGSDKSSIATNAGTFEIGAEPADDDDDGPSGPSGGGDDDDDDDPPESIQESIDEIGAQATNVEEATPEIDTETGTATATFETSENVESITLETTDSSAEVTVTDLDPETQTTNPAPGQSVSLQDITVTGADGDASDTIRTVRFRISNARLQERGTTAENLRAFRLTGGSWQRLETSVAQETADGVVLEARAPGTSIFAVSAVTPPEASLSLNPTTAAVGEDVTLSGVDSSDEDGEIVSYEWSVNGQTFSGETVTVSLDEPGDYTVELTVTDDSGETDTVTETLSITQADTATPTPEPEPETDTPATETEVTTTDTGTPGFGIIVAIIALLGAAAMIGRRRTEN